jgi:hypothetical protein
MKICCLLEPIAWRAVGLPTTMAFGKPSRQWLASRTARHGGGYDNDSGSGYGANTND